MKLFQSLTILSLLLVVFSCNSVDEQLATVNDWPTYKHDNSRNAVSGIHLPAANYSLDWVHDKQNKPLTAWTGAADDPFAGKYHIPAFRDYDASYYPVVVGTKLFFASSSDDAVHCIDTKTGIELWRFSTNGPIRIAPSYYRGRLYIGSDDGNAYCLNAKNGNLIWKFKGKEADKLVLLNGHLISFYPIRSGILIEDDVAYFSSSLLPWKPSYTYAVDALSGKIKTDKHFSRKQISDPVKRSAAMAGYSFEGPMSFDGKRIIQPQGRTAPVILSKTDGSIQGPVPGGAGCFVMVSPENTLLNNKGNTASLTEYINTADSLDSGKFPVFLSYGNGKDMVSTMETTYIVSDNSLSAFDRKEKNIIWRKGDYHCHSIILSGDHLVVGGVDTVYLIDKKNGYPLWEGTVDGVVHSLAVADDAIFASTVTGKIYCFRPEQSDSPLMANKLLPAVIEKDTVFPALRPELEFDRILKYGPIIRYTSPSSVTVEAWTSTEANVSLTFGDTKMVSEKTKHHLFKINQLRQDYKYQYNFVVNKGKDSNATRTFLFDNQFNMLTQKRSDIAVTDEKIQSLLNEIDSKPGICIVDKMDDEELIAAIAGNTNKKLIVLSEDKHFVEKLRTRFIDEGIYSNHVYVIFSDEHDQYTLPKEFADVIISGSSDKEKLRKIFAALMPTGKMLTPDNELDFVSETNLQWETVAFDEKNQEAPIIRANHEKMGSWTHQYGSPDNSAYGGAGFWGITSPQDLEVSWMGLPGPRYQVDRHSRKSAPLASNGRLFKNGWYKIMAMNSFNGTPLWFIDLPDFIRINVPRDCGDWVIDDNYVYAVVRDHCLQLDAETGKLIRFIDVAPCGNTPSYWGYVAQEGESLIGSAISPEGSFLNIYDGRNWFNDRKGIYTEKVLSGNLFSVDKKSGKQNWVYNANGVIINSSITISNGKVYFTESKIKQFNQVKNGRGDSDIFKNNYLVVLDLETGEVIHEKKLEITNGEVPIYFMSAGSGKLVIMASYDGFHNTYIYNQESLELEWDTTDKWTDTHHGEHMSRPAISGEKLIIRPSVYNIHTGELFSKVKIPIKCGTYSLTDNAVFYRDYHLGFCDFDDKDYHIWKRLRAGCWLSSFPSNGMFLAPEGGGGCSCLNWVYMSVGFTPVSRAPLSILYNAETGMVTMKLKPGTDAEVFYKNGKDGMPSEKDIKYTMPFKANNSDVIHAVVYEKMPDGIKKAYKIKDLKELTNSINNL